MGRKADMVGMSHTEAVKAMLEASTLDELEKTRVYIAQPEIATSQVLAAVFDHKFKQLCSQPQTPSRRVKKR